MGKFTRDDPGKVERVYSEPEAPETAIGISREKADAAIQAGQDAQARRTERVKQTIRDLGGDA